MSGHKYVLTGFRDKNLEEAISERGGKVTGTVSGQTTAVITAAKVTRLTGKLQKAANLKVPVYSLAEFKEKYGL